MHCCRKLTVIQADRLAQEGFGDNLSPFPSRVERESVPAGRSDRRGVSEFALRSDFFGSDQTIGWASVTCDISIEQWGRDSDPFPRFRIDLNRDPITALASRLILRKNLDVLPLIDDGFNQIFIKLPFGQQFHVQL